MISRRILLFSILFLILGISLFSFLYINVLNRPRIDTVPEGAYVVPWMRPYPSIQDLPSTFNIDAVMANALKLSVTFTITMWDNSTRVIPSTVYLGHDSQYLYAGGKFVGMHSNPASEPHGWTEPNVFKIYFDVANSGTLTTPEAGSSMAVNIDIPQDTLVGSSWSDMIWVYEPVTYKHMVWIPAENYLESKGQGQTVFSMAYNAADYDNSTGTVTMLFARYLSRPQIADINALQMRSGERWVMGFLLELEFQKALGTRADGWPRTTYGVWSNDSSWWPKLAIDLSNPPATYPGVPL